MIRLIEYSLKEKKMVKKLQKLPAGLFLVPMILSMIVYTIAPDLMMTGGSVDWSPVITTLIPLVLSLIHI